MSEHTSCMVATADGLHAIEVDKLSRWYGWMFWKHPDGQWVSKRKATPLEISEAALHASARLTDPRTADDVTREPGATEEGPGALTVREACRRGMPLDGTDAKALEHALTQLEREKAALERVAEAARKHRHGEHAGALDAHLLALDTLRAEKKP